MEIKLLGLPKRWFKPALFLAHNLGSQWCQLLKWGRKREEQREQGRNFRHSSLNLSNLRSLTHPSEIHQKDFIQLEINLGVISI